MNKIILGALISSCWVNLACGMNKNMMEEDSSIESIDIRNMVPRQNKQNTVSIQMRYKGEHISYKFNMPNGVEMDDLITFCEKTWVYGMRTHWNFPQPNMNPGQQNFGYQNMNNGQQNFAQQNMNNGRNTSFEFKDTAEEQEEKEVRKEEKSNKHRPAPSTTKKANKEKTAYSVPASMTPEDDLRKLIYEIRDTYGAVGRETLMILIKQLDGEGIISIRCINAIIKDHLTLNPDIDPSPVPKEELMKEYEFRLKQIIDTLRPYKLNQEKKGNS